MKKLIITLCLALILAVSLASCGKNKNNNNNNNSESTDTKNDGVITETGTDTSIIDNVESGIKGVRDDIMGAN